MADKKRHASRILGLETEYGCMTGDTSQRVVTQIRDWVFERQRYGLVDRHERDWDEPPGNGGFLFNGGRLYIDRGHIEYCTPECATAGDIVRYDRAGDRLLLAAIKALGLGKRVSFFRNNIDHHSGATFGCHENYSLSRLAPLSQGNVLSLLTFLTLRMLFAGAGRIGEMRRSPDDSGGTEFQISQRADFIENDFYEWVQNNRAIINTRDEPLADPRHYRRLHLLHGDTNVLPSALYLKVGATRLVLDLLEANDLPPVALADAVGALRTLSRQLEPPWRVTVRRGTEADAVELLSRFRTRVAARFGGRDAETDALLALWTRVEKGLSTDLMQLVGLVDWVTKLHLLESFRQRQRLSWRDPWLESLDLEYHHIDPARGLGYALADLKGPWGRRLNDPASLQRSPQDTRAALRTTLMHRFADRGEPYEIDWHCVEGRDGVPQLLLDPFQTRSR